MSTVPKRAIEGDILTTSITTGYTVGTALKFVVHRLAFTNYHDAADAVINVYLVPKDKTAIDDYKVASDKLILNNKTWNCYACEGQVLDAGGTIQYQSDTPVAVTVVCSGVEVTAT